MKKMISLLLVLLIVMTTGFTGCSSRKNAETDTAWEGKGATSDVTTAYEAVEDQESGSIVYGASDTGDVAAGNSIVTEDAATSDTGIAYDSAATKDKDYTVTESDGTKASITFKYDSALPPVVNNSEEYTEITENGFKDTTNYPLSTFSIDVDTASYTNLRKNLNNGIIPEADAVRIEEMLNYFDYDYDQPKGEVPFAINTEIGKCPWNDEHYLLTIGIQGKEVPQEELPASNLVFLIDVSGSMDEPDKLPLLKNAFSRLVEVLGEDDKVSIVVYAGSSGIVLDSVRGNKKDTILEAIDSLSAGGSTGGAAGIELAYKLAQKNYIKNGNNRIILATDGDFNVGPSSVEELEEIITEKRESGIYLSVMGFGSGNLKDNRMETLADKGNGNYSYIDSTKEARKVLVQEMAGTLLTIAKDVKIQIEFNPYSVEGYRLIGYENRALANEDFKDDSVDAGELGAGHRVTAIYEVIPRSASGSEKDLKYRTEASGDDYVYKNEISEIRLRYKKPAETESKEIRQVVTFLNTPVDGKNMTEDFYFAAAIAEFGMILRDSEYKGNSTTQSVLDLAEKGLGDDENGYRLEFMLLVDRYEELLEYRW